jgi:aryl-alcohol dehydrogenase-like predicted oxidoreductase
MNHRSIVHDLKISKLSFGCSSYWSKPIFPERKALKILATAYENSINYFHTAPHYNMGEIRLGKFIRDCRPKKAIFSTSAGRYFFNSKKFIPDLEPKSIETSLEASLKNLNIEAVDILFLYGLFQKDFSNEKFIQDLMGLKKKGKVKFLGLFGMDINNILVDMPKFDLFDAYMLPHSISDNNDDAINILHDSNKLIITFGSISTMKNYFTVFDFPSLWYFLRAIRRLDFSKKTNELYNYFTCKNNLNNNFSSIQNSLSFSLENRKIHSTLINTCNEKHLLENLKLLHGHELTTSTG